MPTGKVKWFNKEKGFGFIVPDAGGNDVFVHISALEKSGLAQGLEPNQKVAYEIENSRGKQQAVDIRHHG